MQRKKEHIDSRIEEANIDKGIVVLLTGNGKGKSSSAMGMICRALGYEMKVALVRFLKGEQQTGEDLFLIVTPMLYQLIWRAALLGILKTKNLIKKVSK